MTLHKYLTLPAWKYGQNRERVETDHYVSWDKIVFWHHISASVSWNNNNYRLTHSASELSGFTCSSSLTMNKKFQYRTRRPSVVLKNFEFIVSERVQVNPDNSRAMSALTFLLFKLNTLQAKIVKFWVSQSHGVMTVVYRILHLGYYTTIMTSRRLLRHNPGSCGTNQPIRKSEFVQCMKVE